MVVVDNTVLADLLVGKENLVQASKRLLYLDPEWIAPDLWRYELGNVLLLIARHKRLPIEAMHGLLSHADSLIQTVVDLDWETILETARASELSYYDASYVWLAREKGIPLYTRDGKILKQCSDVARPMPS